MNHRGLTQRIGETSKFECWITRYGVSRLARNLDRMGDGVSVSTWTVYAWLRGERIPRPPRIQAIVEVARGDLTVEDVEQHFQLKRPPAISTR